MQQIYHQINARYNIERFANNLPRTLPLNNLREPLREGYFPKLDSLVASRSFPPRRSNAVLQNLHRPADEISLEISTMERWRDRILEAIAQGFAVDTNGQRVPLNNEKGIDILGDMMDSSMLSINQTLYGNLHNMGHVLISYQHDPDHRHLESKIFTQKSSSKLL